MNTIKILTVAALLAVPALTVSAQDDTVNTSDNNTSYWLDSEQEGSDKMILHRYHILDNWYIGLQMGGLYNWGTNQGEYNFFRHLRPSAALQIGKWWSPSVGMRAQLIYGHNRGVSNTTDYKTYHWQSLSLYGDGMLNITNMWAGYKESRFFNLILFAGIGGEQTFRFSRRDWRANDEVYNREHNTLLGIRAGLITTFRLSEVFDLSFEVSNTWTDDTFDGVISHNRWDGHANAFLGLNYRFANPSDGGHHQFTYARRDMSRFNDLNNELNRLRADVADARKNVPINMMESKQVNVIVSFGDNKSDIDKMQEVNVYTAAEKMRQLNNQANLYITVLEGKTANEELFTKRANTLKQTLIKEYNLPAGRIFIEKDAKKVEAVDKAINCIILYINENGNK